MTIEQSKTQLLSLIDNADLKVIALTGAWGTGKTHLWNEIRKESQDPIVEGARCVSLFGLKDINPLKLKVVQSALRTIGATFVDAAIARIPWVAPSRDRTWTTADSSTLKLFPVVSVPA